MDRSQLTPEDYGAQFTDPFPAGAELSKDDIIARWHDRYERLKASSARQVSELSDEVLRLSARVSLLESLLDEHGISEYDALPLEDGLAVLMGGARPPKGAGSAVQAVSVVSPAPELQLGAAPLALATGLHTMQNVIAVASLGRVRELEDMPVLLLSGGADKKAVASWLDTTSGSITVVGSVSLVAPVLDIASHPSNELGTSDVAIGAAALMDGSVAIVAVSVDLATAVPIDSRPPVRVSTIATAKDHSKFAVRVKWSPDGTRLAVCSQDHGVTTYAFNIEEPTVLNKLATTQFTGTS